MRAWRQVIAAMPQPGAAPADLQTWLDELSRHLATAQPPADLANVPATSIRAFFAALQTLIGTVASSRPRQRPAQAVHEDEDASEPRGAIRTHAAIDGERRPGPETTLGDGRDALVAERLRPIQEVLVFGDERPDWDPEPANLTLTTSPSLAADELPLSSASARSERRLGSYRLIEISLRLRWSWDHLNAPDLRILVDAIAQDLADDGPRRAGATLCLAMLAFGRSAAQVFDLCVGEGHGASEWIDAEGRGDSASIHALSLFATRRLVEVRLPTGKPGNVFGVGPALAPLMFIGEAPGADEDRQGEPFVGRAGELLDKMIEAMGWGRGDVYIANVLKCRPPGNRNPEPDEVAACRPFLDAQIAAVRPRIIVTLGRPAANVVLGNDAPISALRGRFHEHRGVRVMPTFHPAFLLRQPERKRDAWSDLKQVIAELERLGVAPPRPARG